MGDPACWLSSTCLSCGRFIDAELVDDATCPHCGAELPPAADEVRPAPSVEGRDRYESVDGAEGIR